VHWVKISFCFLGSLGESCFNKGVSRVLRRLHPPSWKGLSKISIRIIPHTKAIYIPHLSPDHPVPPNFSQGHESRGLADSPYQQVISPLLVRCHLFAQFPREFMEWPRWQPFLFPLCVMSCSYRLVQLRLEFPSPSIWGTYFTITPSGLKLGRPCRSFWNVGCCECDRSRQLFPLAQYPPSGPPFRPPSLCRGGIVPRVFTDPRWVDHLVAAYESSKNSFSF